jgi:hypothetical protein
MPPKSWLLGPYRLTIRLGPTRVFAELPNERAGWDSARSVWDTRSKRWPPKRRGVVGND